MLSERMRARLSQLNRQPLPESESPSAARRDGACNLPAATSAPASPTATASCEIAAGRAAQTASGAYWLVERPLAAVWAESDVLVARAQSRPATARKTSTHADWRQFSRHFPLGTAFLDLETCGFAGSMVFLVGLIHDGPDGLTLSQLLARNYAEERAMFCGLWERMQGCEVLLTFNGKSFDWPMVVDRSILHRLSNLHETNSPATHVDLLHHARRRYRRELPNCKLQTLEWYLCGRRRTGDIAGSEIPQAYHDFVRTGDDAQMQTVLHHNALDLITLLQISLQFAES